MLNLVCFETGGILWATGLTWVREVVRPINMEPLPISADYIRGIINVRGEVLPVFDGRQILLAGRPCGVDKDSLGARVLLFENKGETFGLLADGVRGVIHAQPETASRISRTKGIQQIFAGAAVKYSATQSMILLDTEKLAAFFRKNRRK